MNIHIIGRQVDVGDSLKDHIYSIINDLKKYNLNVISTNVILKKEKKEFKIELIFNIKGKHTVVINAGDKDVYTAIDKSYAKASKALRRLSDKLKDSHKDKDSLRDLEIIEDDISEKEIELIQMSLELQKPLDIDEAIQKLKDGDNIFLVFNDNQGIQRTIFERKDGNIGIF